MMNFLNFPSEWLSKDLGSSLKLVKVRDPTKIQLSV